VIYNANGGNGSRADTGIPFGTVYTILSPEEADICRPGFTFVAWNTQPDGSGVYYQPDDTVTSTQSLPLYAQWAPGEGPFDVAYDANGGTGSYTDTGIPFGTAYTILSPEVADISHPDFPFFMAWNTQPDGSGTSYEPGNLVMITNSLILYAQWTSETRPVCARRWCCNPCCNPCCTP